MIPRLFEKYRSEIASRLEKEFGYKNIMEVPKIDKIIVNIGAGEAKTDIKFMDVAIAALRAISGQQPLMRRSKRSIAGFKLRQGLPVGCMVTLRGRRMWEFLDRLVSLALPTIKDFQGVSPRGFDGRGNYNLGLREQLIFPEINYDKVIRPRGMNVSIVTTAKTDQEAHALLKSLGMPFNR